jgi:hypothetical protein
VSDITKELRDAALRAEQEGEPLALLDDAAGEIARLRAELSGARQQAEAGQPVLSDAERDLLLRLGPSADASAAYRAQLSPEDRRTAYALLERLGGGR